MEIYNEGSTLRPIRCTYWRKINVCILKKAILLDRNEKRYNAVCGLMYGLPIG